MNSGFQVQYLSLVDSGFLELCSGFQGPGFQIPQRKFAGLRFAQAKISRIPFQNSLHGTILSVLLLSVVGVKEAEAGVPRATRIEGLVQMTSIICERKKKHLSPGRSHSLG